MALTNLSQVTSSGIHTLSNYTTHNINSTGIITATEFSGNLSNSSGISTFAEIRVTGNLTVEGTTTTLDSNLTEVDRIEVGANSTNPGIAVTQSGTGVAAFFNGGDVNIATGNLALASATPMVVASNGSGHLRLGAGGLEKVRITSAGLVGIGISTPAERLAVVAEEDSNATDNGLSIYRSVADDKVTINAQGGAAKFIADGGSSYIPFRFYRYNGTNLYETLTIGADGYVGIGTDSPLVKLDSRGTVQSTGSSITSAANWISAVGNGSAYDNMRMWYTGYNGGAPRLYISPGTSPGSGNIDTYLYLQSNIHPSGSNTLGLIVDGIVGIGTNNPARKLHINSGTTDTAMLIESTDNDVQINLKDANSSDGVSIGARGDDFYVRTGLTTERLRITSEGSALLTTTGQNTQYSYAMKLGQGTYNPNDATGPHYGLWVRQLGPRYQLNYGIYSEVEDDHGFYGGAEIDGLASVRGIGVYGSSPTSSHSYQKGIGVYGKATNATYNYNTVIGVRGRVETGTTTFTANNGQRSFGGHFVATGKADVIGVYADAYLAASPGANQEAIPLLVASDGSEKLRVTSNGKIGINDTNPERAVDIRADNCMVQLEGTGGGGRQYSLCSTDNTTGASAGSAGSFVIYDDTSGNARLSITSDGTVHINSADSASGGRIYATSSKLYLQSGNGRQSFNIADMASGQSATHEFNSSGNLVLAGSASAKNGVTLTDTDTSARLNVNTDLSGNYTGWKERNVASGSMSQASIDSKTPTINDFTYPNSSDGMLVWSTSKIGFAAGGESPQYGTGVQMLFDSGGLMLGGIRAFDRTSSTSTTSNWNIKLNTAGQANFKGQVTANPFYLTSTDSYVKSVYGAVSNSTVSSLNNLLIGQNMRGYLNSDGGNVNNNFYNIVTHGGMGYCGTEYCYGGITKFYNNTGGSTANATFTPKERVRLTSSRFTSASGFHFSTNSNTNNELPNPYTIGDINANSAAYPHTPGIYFVTASCLCDNTWRTLFTSINDSNWVIEGTSGDASSKRKYKVIGNPTSPSYGVNLITEDYNTGGWNTGDIEFRLDGTHPNWNLQVKCTSYYNTSNISGIRFMLFVYY